MSETVTKYAERHDISISLVYYWIGKERLDVKIEKGIKKIQGFPDKPYIKKGGRPRLETKTKQYKNKLGKLIQRGKQGDVIREWDTVKDASEFFGCGSNTIVMAINEPSKTSCGFIWTRKDK